MFKPTRNVMKRIGERVQRKSFRLKLEKQGDEYIARFNWNIGAVTYTYIPIASIVYRKLGKSKDPVLTVTAQLGNAFVNINKADYEEGKLCFDSVIKEKFGDSFNYIRSAYTGGRMPIKFSANFSLENKKRLSLEDLDKISDFIHNSFGCWIKKSNL